MSHQVIERHVGLLMLLTLFAVSAGGTVEFLPLLFGQQEQTPAPGVVPLGPAQLVGRDIYIREGCHGCHTQMVRRLMSDTRRYGPYSTAGEDVYEHPFLWGSKRTGPDLARVGGRYSDAWHAAHLYNPRAVVPTSNMPAYPWLVERTLDDADPAARMRALRSVGVPYDDATIAAANAQVAGVTESQALIAYLQQLRAPPGSAPGKAP